MLKIEACRLTRLTRTLVVLWLCGCTSDIMRRPASPQPVLVPPPSNSGVSSANLNEPPAVVGTHLQVVPGNTATERALDLAEKLAASESARKLSGARVHELEMTLEAKDKAILQAGVEVQKAREELAGTKTELEKWKEEIVTLRDRLRSADKENLTTLQTTVALLQQMLGRVDQNEENALPEANSSKHR